MTQLENHRRELKEIINEVVDDLESSKSSALLIAFWDLSRDIERLKNRIEKVQPPIQCPIARVFLQPV